MRVPGEALEHSFHVTDPIDLIRRHTHGRGQDAMILGLDSGRGGYGSELRHQVVRCKCCVRPQAVLDSCRVLHGRAKLLEAR